MGDTGKPTSAPWVAQPGGSYLSLAYGFLALFGPRPAFIFSTRRAENAWLEWTESGRHHGLARFAIQDDGTVVDVPILQAVPERKKKCWTSSRQFRGQA